MIRIYSGFDPRESVGYHTFCASVIERASEPISFTPLHLPMLDFYSGGARDGTNTFAFSRFLIPYMEKWTGYAVFMDGADMVVLDDVAKLIQETDARNAVSVVKNVYQSKHPRKYVGTGMEAENRPYDRKNWSSVMVINCNHFAWRDITPEFVAKADGLHLHQFKFIEDRFIGELDPRWNWLVDEYGPREDAKVLHWTAGIPGFPHYKDAPMASVWKDEHRKMNHAID